MPKLHNVNSNACVILTLRYSSWMFNSFEYEIIHEITYISDTYTHITFIKKHFTSGHISCLYIVYHRHHHITTHTSFNLSLLLRFSNTSNFFYRIGSNQHNHLRANNVASIGVLCGLGVCVWWFGHGIDLNMRLCV